MKGMKLFPSLETAKKIANAFEVTLDYLVDNTASATFDKPAMKRIQLIQNLKKEDKEHVFAMLDAFLRDLQAKAAYF